MNEPIIEETEQGLMLHLHKLPDILLKQPYVIDEDNTGGIISQQQK